jgi:hypothetical protein
MYDLGFPPPLQQSIAHKFNTRYFNFTAASIIHNILLSYDGSLYAAYLVSYRPSHKVIDEYGYAVVCVDQVITHMHGVMINDIHFLFA